MLGRIANQDVLRDFDRSLRGSLSDTSPEANTILADQLVQLHLSCADFFFIQDQGKRHDILLPESVLILLEPLIFDFEVHLRIYPDDWLLRCSL